MNDWQARLLRLTLFPSVADVGVDPQNWWQEVIGEPPDAINSQPKIGRFAGEADYGLGKLILKTQRDRIDWVYLVSEPEDPTELRTLGDYSSALNTFLNVVNKWMRLPTIPDAKRIAHGCILISPAENKEAAYAHLNLMLPSVTVDEQNSSDFIYQINRPRVVTINSSESKINRLSKWAVGSDIEQHVVLTGASPQHTTIVHNVYSQLELDINTTPEAISADMLSVIFNNLVQMGQEIAKDGDVS